MEVMQLVLWIVLFEEVIEICIDHIKLTWITDLRIKPGFLKLLSGEKGNRENWAI